MTAAEARSKTNQLRESASSNELKVIRTKIRQAVGLLKFNLELRALSGEAKDILESEGYLVSSFGSSVRDDGHKCWEISW